MAETRRANKIVTRLFIGQIIAFGALIVAVVVLQEQTKSSIESAQEAVRVEQTQQLRQGCVRGVRRDFESYGTNSDLAGFARDAATARRLSHQFVIARRYDKRAEDAEARMATIKLRLPASNDEASISLFCDELYPVPG